MQTLIDIPEEDLSLLDQLSQETHLSRQELVGAALTEYLKTRRARVIAKQERDKIIDEAIGSWADFPEDGLAYQERIRSEWER